MLSVIWSLGKHWVFTNLWWCNRFELWDPESLRRNNSEKSVANSGLEDQSAVGRLGLKSLLFILVLQLILIMNHFGLSGRKEVFMPSSLVFCFDNISGVILYLHPLLLYYFFFVNYICPCFI